MNHQAFGVSYIGKMGEKLQAVDELPAGRQSACDPENNHAAVTLFKILTGNRVGRIILQSRVSPR